MPKDSKDAIFETVLLSLSLQFDSAQVGGIFIQKNQHLRSEWRGDEVPIPFLSVFTRIIFNRF